MEKTMLDILKKRIIEGLSVKSVKETNTKYIILFEFEGDETKADLPKTCAPGYHNKVADTTIIIALINK